MPGENTPNDNATAVDTASAGGMGNVTPDTSTTVDNPQVSEQEAERIRQETSRELPAGPSADERRNAILDVVNKMVKGDQDTKPAATRSPDPATARTKPADPSRQTSQEQADNRQDTGTAVDPGQLSSARSFLEGMNRRPKDGTADADVVESAVAAAQDVLRRAQFDDDDFKNLSTDRLLSKAAKQHEREVEASKIASRLARMEKDGQSQQPGTESASGSAQASADTKNPSGTKPASTADAGDPLVALSDGLKKQIDEVLAPLQNEDNRDYYGDLVEPLGILSTTIATETMKSVRNVVDQITAQYQKNLDGLMSELDGIHLRHTASMPQIQEQFPELSDPENYRKVENKVRQLANLNGYHDENGIPRWEKLLTEAANSVLGNKNTLQQAQSRALDEQRKLDNSRGHRPNAHQLRKGGAITDIREATHYAIQQLAEGVPAEEVRQKLAATG